ncbi:MAG: reverse transcriptase family protein [bacterium]|nr:reverse transcriptase family protein [bacterium]
MKLEQAYIDQIRTAFEKMQSRADLLHVLNEAKPLVYGEKAVPFELKQLTWYANPKLGRKRYAEFKIKKKSGAERCINAPVKGLKSLQKTLSFVLQCVYEPHNAVMGFVRDKSIVDNAKLHVGSRYVYNIDLKDFFPSVDQARVWKCIQLKPFNLNKASSAEPQYMKWEDFKREYLKTEGPVKFLKGKGRMFTKTPYGTIYVASNYDKEKDNYILLGSSSLKTKTGKSLEGTLWLVNKIPDTSRLDIANIIASLCCTEMEVGRKTASGEWEKVKRNVLPQGAPTSPVITNIVCQRLDYILTGVVKRFGLKYSRYADDITFSSMHNVYQPESDFLKELHRIIAEQGFHIKESKTRLQKDGYRKEVTGLLVNEKANVQKRYIKQLRMWLYYWERYGYERASGFFIEQYVADKGRVIKGKPDMTNVIGGKLDFLKMVKGADNELYLKLKGRFDKLTNKHNNFTFEPMLNSNIGSNIGLKEIEDLGNGEETKEIVSKNNDRENDVELILRPIGKKSSLKLLVEMNIPEGTILPYSELFNNKAKKQVVLSENQISLPLHHNPKQLTDILKVFSDNNNPLKYTTHSWEYGRFESYDQFINQISKEWKDIKQKLSILNNRLSAKISNFLFNKKLGIIKDGYPQVWGEHKLKFGWGSPLLSDYLKTETKDPFNFPIPKELKDKETLRNLNYFNDYVDIFKNEIEIREDGNQLEKIFNDLWSIDLTYDFNLTLENLKGVSFYTDVPWLKESIKIILRSFRKRTAFNEIKISLKRDFANNIIELHLTQVGSVCTRSIEDQKISNVNNGDFSTLFKNFKNLCDWSICAEFPDKTHKQVNYLTSINGLANCTSPNFNCEGFTHILTFHL